ncbi:MULTISPECIES: hypothetical protein [unclassified Francisella]|uniref:hypothetical protein n=1 Tax=unclassified Francisella TaxID=2610885 RepID=UPI002E31FB83|nr:MULTISPECIES: hypothetical protein [unclassified Francisella]MED7820213.1 hypothetical protein [Francisella sp. 19S2-4]MED7831049.1 hypothetical protein [Francisella sp. 19S2-10]
MKNISKIFVMLGFAFLLQDCSTNSVDNDFSYENLSETVSGEPFRNRKYDYARVQVKEEPSLKIPDGLNGNKIDPALKLPEGDNNYAKSQVTEAQKEMLPPNYSDKFDMAKIIDDQIAKVSISVLYDDTGALKLVFREPIAITLNLLEEYFKDRPNDYKLLSVKDEILSGNVIKVEDIHKKLIFVIKARKVDDLSSLVKVNAVFTSDGKTEAPDHISESVKLLSDIRKALNNTKLTSDANLKIVKQTELELTKSSDTTKDNKQSMSGLSGSAKKSKFGAGSYDMTMRESQTQSQQESQSNQDYTQMTAPSGSEVYNSDAQPQVLNT